MEKSVAGKNANTNISAYSINHPDGRKTVEKCYALKHDKLKDNKGSEPRLDPIGDTTDDYVVVLDDSPDYGRLVHFVKSDSEACDKGTADDPVDVITITADDIEEEPVTLNSVSQGKATRKSIPREGIHHSPIGPELEDGKVNVNTDTDGPCSNNHPDGRNSAETEPRLDPTAGNSDDLTDVIYDTPGYDKTKAENTDEKPVAVNSSSHKKVDRDSNPRKKMHHANIEKSGPKYDEEIHPDSRNTSKTNYALGLGKREDNHDSEPKMVQTVETIDDLTEVTNEYVPQQSLQGLTRNGPGLAGMLDDRAKQEDNNIEDETEVRKLTAGIEKEMKPGKAVIA